MKQMTRRTAIFEEFMEESSSSRYESSSENEIFSRTCIRPQVPFFVRLDGWRFRKLAERLRVDKPFDERVARCLVMSGKILFLRNLSPKLIYVASDELNVLFVDGAAPFRGKVEKINSVLAGLVASAFSLNLQKFFNDKQVASFDSRIIVASNARRITEYLALRQANAWRNHNNAYAYWIFRKMGHKPTEVTERLKGLTSREIYETLFEQGVNLVKTPQWQRRGILVHKQPFPKKTEHGLVTRWKLVEDWNLPLFASKRGENLVRRIVEWTMQKRMQ